MKNYQITFSVPDDFVPEELELNVNYKDEINIVGEGDLLELPPNIRSAIKDKVTVDVKEVTPDSVVIYRFPPEWTENAPLVYRIKEGLQEILLTDKIFGIVNNVDVLIENSEGAIQMLEVMLAKIKTRSIILQK